jgi:hypothetical protein
VASANRRSDATTSGSRNPATTKTDSAFRGLFLPSVLNVLLGSVINSAVWGMNTHYYNHCDAFSMQAENLNDQLDEYFQQLEEHLDTTVEDLESCYLKKEPQDDSATFKQHPHKLLFKRAVSVFEYIFEYNQGIRCVNLNSNWGPRDITLTHLGIGFEALINAIYLKINPEKYIAEIKNSEHDTPNHKTAKNQVMGSLPDKLISEQRKQISLVIDKIREHRNNTLHLGLYRYYQQGLSVAFFEVAGYLIHHFSDKNSIS